MTKLKLGSVLKEEKTKIGKDDGGGLDLIGVSNEFGLQISKAQRIPDLSRYKIIKTGWLAYNPMRVNVGSIGIAKGPEHEGIVSPDYVVFSCTEKILPDYLLFFLKSDLGLEAINKNASGAVRKRLYYSDLARIELNVPSIERQQEILGFVRKIEAMVSQLRDPKRLEKISQLKQSILQEAFQGKLTEEWRALRQAKQPPLEPASELLKRIQAEKARLIKEKKIKKGNTINHPENLLYNSQVDPSWTICKADQILFVTKLAGFEYTNHFSLQPIGDVPVIRAQNVRPISIDKTNLLYIDRDTSDLLDRCSLVKKCLLVTFIGAGIGDVATFEEKTRWHLAPNVAKMEPFEGCESMVDVKYLNYFLLSPEGRKEIFKHIKATAQPSLSMSTLRDIDFFLPPFEEQKAIVEKVESLMEKCRALEEEISQSEQHAQMLMQAVLKEAFESD